MSLVRLKNRERLRVSKLDGQIYNDILHRDIADDEKAKLYSSSLGRYLNIDKPSVVTKFDSAETVKDSNDVESTILGSVPKTWWTRASQLLNHIKNNPDISCRAVLSIRLKRLKGPTKTNITYNTENTWERKWQLLYLRLKLLIYNIY